MKEPYLAHSDLTGAIYIVVGNEKYEVTEQAKQAVKAVNKGHWIDTDYHQYYNDGDFETTELRCSRCNEEVEWNIKLAHKPYYCENCGAYMISEVEE